MSLPVIVRDLPAAVRARGPAAFVLTVSERGAPHVVHARVELTAGRLVAVVGASTARNAQSRREVSLLYPARDSADYSLIVDATVTEVTGDGEHRLLLLPTRAVLHRPGAAPDPAASSCGSDCVPLTLREPATG